METVRAASARKVWHIERVRVGSFVVFGDGGGRAIVFFIRFFLSLHHFKFPFSISFFVLCSCCNRKVMPFALMKTARQTNEGMMNDEWWKCNWIKFAVANKIFVWSEINNKRVLQRNCNILRDVRCHWHCAQSCTAFYFWQNIQTHVRNSNTTWF